MVPPKNFLAYLLIVFRGIIGEPFFLFFYKSLILFYSCMCIFSLCICMCIFSLCICMCIFSFIYFYFQICYISFFMFLFYIFYKPNAAKLSVWKVVDLILVHGQTFGEESCRGFDSRLRQNFR